MNGWICSRNSNPDRFSKRDKAQCYGPAQNGSSALVKEAHVPEVLYQLSYCRHGTCAARP